MSHLLDRDGTDQADQAVINTVADTPVYAKIIQPGMWPGNVLLVEQTGRYCNGSANGRTYAFRLKLNGITVTRQTVGGTASSASFYAAVQRWSLVAVSTDRVIAVMRWGVGGVASDQGLFAAAPATPGGGSSNRIGDVNLLITDPVYVDLSKPVGMEISMQLSTATATHQFISMGVWVGVLTNQITAATHADYSELSYAQGG